MPQKFDDIIIGAGQAGPSLAARLTQAGRRVAVVERKYFGGTCVNNGCIPTKTMVANARVAQYVRRAAEFGVMLNGPTQIDMQKVKARKDAIVKQSRDSLEKWLTSMENCTVFRGSAVFESHNRVSVGEARLAGDRIFINVGARADIPPIPGIETVPYLTNSSMMDVDFLPDHLVIIGGSYIGLEFAQMFRRFGSKVTVIELNENLIAKEDSDISQAIQQILQDDGIQIHTGAVTKSVQSRGKNILLSLSVGGKSIEVEGSHLLVATGRRPNTDDLQLDKAGVKFDSRGYIVVDDQLQTSTEGIWALGECNGKGPFTHTAYNDFQIVSENLLNDGSRRVSDRILTYALFIDPPLGRAGMTEKQVRQSGRKALIATMPMTHVGRAREQAETNGFMKILVDVETEQILGAALLGLSGDEVIHSILDIMYAKAPYTTIKNAVHIHPTVTELIPTLLEKLQPLEYTEDR